MQSQAILPLLFLLFGVAAPGGQAVAEGVNPVNHHMPTGVPADPGETGRVTLLGIDADQDGVRDDVERWIVFSHPDSERARAALRQLAQSYQYLIMGAGDPELTYEATMLMSGTYDCLSFIDGRQAHAWVREIKTRMLNTRARSRAYLKANRQLGGRVLNGLPYERRKQGCNFDPDAMAN